MVDNRKLTTDDSVRRSPRDSERQHPRNPKRRRSTHSDDVCATQFEAVIESVDEGVAVCDPAGCVVRMNRRALDLHEYAGVEHAWRSVSDFADQFELHTPAGSAISSADWPLSRAVRGETFRDMEVRIRNKRTETERTVRCGGTPVRDSQGNVALAVLTLRELPEQTESESRLQSVFRAAPVGIGLVANRVLLDVNDRLCEMVGYRREELIGRNSRMLYPTQEEWEHVGREKYRQIGERGTGQVETRWQRKTGEVIDVLLSSTPLDPEDLAKGVTFTALDITDRKRVEDELQSIFDLSLDMVCIADIRTVTFTKVNPAFERTLGYSEQELLGRPCIDFIHPDDVDETMALVRSSMDKGEYVLSFENRLRCKDGSYRWLNWTAHPRIERGLTYAIARDVTERKQAEEAMRFTQFAIDHMADAAFWMTRDARFCYVNEAACRALGYSHDELMRMTVYDIDPTFTKKIWSDSWRKLKAEKSRILETVHRARDGRLYPVEIRANYVEFGGRAYDCAFARDITERKQAEEALRESEGRHRRLIENLKGSHFVYVHGTDGVFQYVSESITGILGYTSKEFMTHYATYLTDHPANEAARRYTELTIQGIRQPPYEVNTWHKDGSTRWLEVQEVPVLDEEGRVVAVEGVAQDITVRKRAEEALRESEERHRFLVESVNDWIWEVDQSGVYTYVSPQCREMLGYEPQEIVGKTPFDLMPPDEAVRLRKVFVAITSPPKPVRRLENVNRRKDGRLVVLETNGVPVLDAQGKLTGYRGVDRDITERKQAEEALREKEYLLSESQRIGHIGTWSVDLITNVATWTRETYRLYGVSPETFVPSAETLLGLLHPDDRGAMREWMRAALAGEHPDTLESRIVLPDGSIRILSGRGELIFSDDNKPVRLVGTAQDVTEERQTEAALRELSRKNEEALRVARMGHWEFDVAAGLFIFNDQYYTLHGTTAQEAGGYQMTSDEFERRYVHPDDAGGVEEAIHKAVASDDPDFQLQTEARILRTDGEMRWVTVWFRIEKDAQGRTIKLHGVNQDITERRRAEEALRRLNEHLELLVARRTADLTHMVARLQQLTWELSQTEDRERKRIADLLHDDVQQILAGARFHLNLLSTETRSAEDSQAIILQVRQMLREAIEKARSLSHELSPALYQVDLAEILNWLGCHMEHKHGLTVHVEVHGQVDSSSEPLKALLYKVAQELLFNVVKHAGVNEATICVRRKGRYISLAVSDRGLGFNPRELEKTVGFGLLGIRERIELLGGRMKIKSAPGMGSRLLIVVPDQGPSLPQRG